MFKNSKKGHTWRTDGMFHCPPPPAPPRPQGRPRSRLQGGDKAWRTRTPAPALPLGSSPRPPHLPLQARLNSARTREATAEAGPPRLTPEGSAPRAPFPESAVSGGSPAWALPGSALPAPRSPTRQTCRHSPLHTCVEGSFPQEVQSPHTRGRPRAALLRASPVPGQQQAHCDRRPLFTGR